MDALVTAVLLVGLPFASTLVAATILAVGISGPIGLLAGPCLMLFGWFYAPIVIGLHFLAWIIWPRFRSIDHGRMLFGLAGTLVGACLFAVIGIKEEGSLLRYTISYAVAAGTAAFLSCRCIAWLRNE